MIDANLKAKDRIYENLPDDLKELMKQYILSDEEHERVLREIKVSSYFEKEPVDNPKFILVLGQTGSGKSNLRSSLIRENPNMVVIDSDKYKAYRKDSASIQEKFLTKYAFLTAPDAYQHRDEMIEDTMKSKYNILMECATSEKDGVFIDVDDIISKGYNVEIAVLGVSELNSLLSIHERYESQMKLIDSAAKLTSIDRHNDSYTSLTKCVKDIEGKGLKIQVYKRGINVPYNPVKIYSSTDEIKKFHSAIEALEYCQNKDGEKTIKEFGHRFSVIQQQMISRQAPKEQYMQLQYVLEKYREKSESELNISK